MRYETCPKPLLPDPLEYNCFLHRDPATGFNKMVGRNYCWEVKADTSRRFADDLVLWGNEFPGAWGTTRPGPLRTGIRLQVQDFASCSDSLLDVVTVILRESIGPETSIPIDTLHVRWVDFDQRDEDRVVFSSAPKSLPMPMYVGTADSSQCGLLLEVHSRRYVTARITWVAIEEEAAHELLAGYDLNPRDPELFERSYAVRTRIKNAPRQGVQIPDWQSVPRARHAPCAFVEYLLRSTQARSDRSAASGGR